MGIDITVIVNEERTKCRLSFICDDESIEFYLKEDNSAEEGIRLSLDKEQCVKLMALVGHDIFIHDKP